LRGRRSASGHVLLSLIGLLFLLRIMSLVRSLPASLLPMKPTLKLVLIPAALVMLAGCQDPGASANPSAAAGAAAKPYPLDVCIVSGEKLGSMGDPILLVHQGQEVKLCCKSCKPDFEKEPAKFLSKLTPKK
jgi:hypothetical protein